MNRFHVWIPQDTPALRCAAAILARSGISFADGEENANVVIYPVPTPRELRPPSGGHPVCIGGHAGFPLQLDLLEDAQYLAMNARITAEAALELLLRELPDLLEACPVLILGWGRIGICLAALLLRLGAPVRVYARNPRDRAQIRSVGAEAVGPEELATSAAQARCIVNTVPAVLLTPEQTLRRDCVLLDLASGIFLPGERVISARGLPGRCKWEASGALIARCTLEFLKGVTFP